MATGIEAANLWALHTAKPVKAIVVWRFDDAPRVLQHLSTNGGDEDWIAYIPADVYEDCGGYIPWIESGAFDAGLEAEKIKLPCGDWIYIGSHA